MRGRKLSREACSASTDSAHATSAAFASRRARTTPSAANAPMNCVPLTSERPSFASRRSGSSPARASASPPASSSPSNRARPSPTSGSARCASGARSPLAPTDPRLGTSGTTSAAQTVEQQLGDLDARAGVALRERVRAHDHRRPHDLPRIRLADPAGVAPQEAELELLGQLLGNPRRDEAPEAGRDAVGRLVLAQRVFDDRARRGKLLAGRIVELGGSVLDRDVPDVVRGEVLPGQADRGRPSHGGASLALSPRGRTRA